MTRARRLVLILAFVVFAWNAWGYDLWAPDEPYFAEGAREMLADGQWLVPHVNGVVTTDKPPLFFWLIALCSAPFGGVASLTARIPSILAGLGTVWLTMRLGRRLGGERTGVVAGIVMATSYLLWDKARSAQIDSLLCFLVLAAISAFEAWRAGDLDGRRAGWIFWIAGGLATIAKGPVGFLLPLGAALVVLAFDRDLKSWRRFAPFTGPLLCLAVIALWALPAELWGGEYSLFGALKTHFFDRALHGMHHKNPPWYYVGAIAAQFMPWTPLLPGAVLLAWRRRAAKLDRLLLLWPLFVVLFFTLSGERRDLYVLPAYPALALLVARLASRAAGWDEGEGRESVSTRWTTWGCGVAGAFFLIAGLAAPLVARRQAEALYHPALAVGFVAAATGVCALVAAFRARPRAAFWAVAGGVSAVFVVAVSLLYPPLDAVKSARSFAVAARAETEKYRAAGGEVLAFDLSNVPEALSYYGRGFYTKETDDAQALAAHLGRPEEAFAVVSWRDARRALPPELLSRLTILERRDLSKMDVALVVNRPAAPGAAR